MVIPPVTDAWAVNIRKFVNLRAHTLDELVRLGSLSPAAARFLDASVRVGLAATPSLYQRAARRSRAGSRPPFA